MSHSPQQPVVLVTGANVNTGLTIARHFASQGFKVFVNGRRQEEVMQAVASIEGDALPLVADLSDPAQIDAMFAELARHSDRLDVLVNNACHLGSFKNFTEMTIADFESVLAVNLRAVFYTSQHAAKIMMTHGGGAIVNVGSNTAQRAIRGRCDYIAAKGGVEAMTRALALELGPKKIRVNVVSPGYINTNRWETLPAEHVVRRRDNLPLDNEATTQDVADAVFYMASPQARAITGTILTVDAGAAAQLVPLDCEV
ncbi:MAG: SDR family NAD(P)-dependent oxidoreductase [Phycisphaeraceae bacterium JB051]